MSFMPLSERLRSLRKKYNLTQQNVGDYLHITRQGYSHYENGTRIPDVHTLKMLADLYRITLEELIHFQENSASEKDVAEDKIAQNKTAADKDFRDNGDKTADFEVVREQPLDYAAMGLSKRQQSCLNCFSKLTSGQQMDFLELLHVKLYRQRLRENEGMGETDKKKLDE